MPFHNVLSAATAPLDKLWRLLTVHNRLEYWQQTPFRIDTVVKHRVGSSTFLLLPN
jgi:hypothetical protein